MKNKKYAPKLLNGGPINPKKGYRLATGEYVSPPAEVVGKKPTMFEQRIKSAGKDDSYKAKNLQKFLYDGVGMLPGLWGKDSAFENIVLENLPFNIGRAFSIDDAYNAGTDLIKDGGKNSKKDFDNIKEIIGLGLKQNSIYETVKDLKEDNDWFNTSSDMKSKKKYANGGQMLGQGLQMAGTLANLIPGVGTIAGMGLNLIGGAVSQNAKFMENAENEAVKIKQNTPTGTLGLPNYCKGGKLKCGGKIMEDGGPLGGPGNPKNWPKMAFGGKMNYKNGGSMLKEYNGPSHEEGGIPVDHKGNETHPMNAHAEVEGGETSRKGYVFSDKLLDPTTGKTFAEMSKKISNKYKPKHNDMIREKTKELEFKQLETKNDKVRNIVEQVQLNSTLQNMVQMANGGNIPKYNNGGGLPPEALTEYGDIYNPTSSYPNIYYRNDGNNWYTYDTKANSGWQQVAANNAAIKQMNTWKGNQDKLYSQANPEYFSMLNEMSSQPYQLPIKSPVAGLIPMANLTTGTPITDPKIPSSAKLATKKAYGLDPNKVVTLEPGQRYEGVDDAGKPIIGNQGINDLSMMPRIKSIGDNPLTKGTVPTLVEQGMKVNADGTDGTPGVEKTTSTDATDTNQNLALTKGDKIQMASNFISPAFNLAAYMQGYDREPEAVNKYAKDALNKLNNLRIRPDFNPIHGQANATRTAINAGSSGMQRLASMLGVNNQVANTLASAATQVANANTQLDANAAQAHLIQGERDRAEKIRAKGVTDANQAAQFNFLSKAFEQLGPAVGTIGSGMNNRAELMTQYNMMKNIYPDFSLVSFDEFVKMFGASNWRYTGGKKNFASGNVAAAGAGASTTNSTTTTGQ